MLLIGLIGVNICCDKEVCLQGTGGTFLISGKHVVDQCGHKDLIPDKAQCTGYLIIATEGDGSSLLIALDSNSYVQNHRFSATFLGRRGARQLHIV